ncbi:hypothetical protein TAMC210_05350 [Thermanaeromonas sp. C210]|nr:hypothetical protein TAMC210_05350 [Thermanaeromonas sp. C210]
MITVNVNLEELRRRVAAAGEGKANLLEMLRVMGLSPDNQAVQQLLLEAGFRSEELGSEEKLAELVKQVTQNLTPEAKKNIATLYQQLAKDMGGEIPQAVQQFLADWQKE